MNVTTISPANTTAPVLPTGNNCPALDTSLFDITTADRTQGTELNVTCTKFGHRVVGSKSLLCNASSLWEPAVPTCEWTWEFTTHELVVLGTALGCLILVVVIIIAIIIGCCCCRRRKEKNYNDMNYGDNPGYAGDAGGAYPDAYFAYQDMSPDKQNGNQVPHDRSWLGYIPRPKVAETHYYHYH